MDTSVLSTAVSWLLTYLLHSTLLLGLVWAVTLRGRLRGARPAETLWRTALFGALLTTTLHVGLGAPLWRTPLVVTERVAVPPPPAVDAAPRAASAASARPAAGEAGAASGALASAPVPPAPSFDVAWLLALWPLGVGARLLRDRRRRRQLRRELSGRADLAASELGRLLEALRREAGLRRRVRLTVSSALASPVALGWIRPEVCLPERALRALDDRHLEAMLAHEVAHLKRLDPVWLAAYRALAAVLFFQPLNHLAVGRLRDTAEMLCDAWAARRGERRLALAEVLMRVADWLVDRPTLLVPTMARERSLLGRRVGALLDGAPPGERPRSALPRAVALGALVATALLAPGFAPHRIAAAKVVPAPEVTGAHPSDPLQALDLELQALLAEAAEVEALLTRAGRAPLAGRLRQRLAALEARRDALVLQTRQAHR